MIRFLAFLLCLIFSIGAVQVSAYEYDFSKPEVYTFPLTPADQDKLIYTSELMQFIESEYKTTIETTHLKARFAWNFDWQQTYLGAGTTYYQNTFTIMLLGGMVRAPGSNFSLIAFTLCHEVGHYLGGHPKQRFSGEDEDDWASAEGQADWFAAHSCLPKVYRYFKKHKPERLIEVSYLTEALPFCSSYSAHADLCQWMLSAGLGFVRFAHYYYERQSPLVSLAFEASERPIETVRSAYPSLQCRLDTAKQGTYCALESLGYKNINSQCQRPACWYRD